MSTFISAVKAFARDENGVTAIEYGLLAALIGFGLVVGATALGTSLGSAFSTIGTKISTLVK